ncbi:MAG: energy-coupling factor transporter ATPase [Bacillota bacterium]
MIQLKNVSFAYESGKNSVEDVSLTIKKGEFVVLCGRSGCGKTTITRLMNGLIPHFHEGTLTGEVIVDSKKVSDIELSDLSATCGSMFQNPKSQFFNIDTTSELAFGCENLALSHEEIQQRITKTVDDLSLSDLMERNIFQLSGGEKQQIAIGSIYAAGPEIYILDEPSSNMDTQAIERLKTILFQLKAQGKTIIISEHRLYFLLGLADRFLYFEDGALTKEISAEEFAKISDDDLHAMGLRHTRLENVVQSVTTIPNREKGISVKGLKCFRNEKQVLSLSHIDLKKNAVVAIIGENGAGKSTFIESVSGFLPTRGDVFLGEHCAGAKERVEKSYVVMQDVNRQLFCSTVKEEIMLETNLTEQDALELMAALDIAELSERHPASLSGGQKQRVAICSGIAAQTELMFYDEPTSGLDYKGMKNFCTLINETKEKHRLTMIITHDYELILGSCTHVLHLEKGQVVDTYPIDARGKEKLENFFINKERKMSDVKELKQKKQSLLKNLMTYSDGLKWYMYLGLFLSAVSAVLLLVPIISVWYGVREVFAVYPNITLTDELLSYAYIAVGSAIASIFIYGCALMLTHWTAFRVARTMKSRAIAKLMDLPLGYFTDTGSGKIRRTLNETIAKTETYLAHQMPDMMGAFVTPLAVLFFVFMYDWRLGLVSLIPLVLSCAAMGLMMGVGTADRLRQYQNSLESMNNEAVEYVRGISVVKTFGQSIFSFKKFHKTIEEYRGFVVEYSIVCRMPMVIFQTLLGCVSFFLVIGGMLIFSYASDTKAFLLDFLFYLFFTPIYGYMMMRLMWVSQNTQLAQDAIDRTEDMLNETTLTYKTESKKPTSYDIEIKNVTFAYPRSEKNAVEDINISMKQGQTVALVGGSGGGKSTIATLIARFFDVNDGSITIGGVDVKDMSETDIMDSISFVFQNTNLYKMSILDNVREGNPNATEAEVMNALKSARCEEIIAKLPDGIHTVVGTKGVYLSGGESQRIAIARAIVKNAPIILLDEATAFTDPENEHEIQLAMEKLAENKTVLMIAHRLSTIQNADQIFHIDHGKMVEHGTHQELLEQKGKYFDMWEEYNRAFVWEKEEVANQ